MTAVEHLIAHPEIPHGAIKLGFTSDEEIGQGIRHFDIEAFGAEAAYTLDDSEAGAICGETFSADRAIVKIAGRSAHPGTARGRMVSALKVAADVIAALPLDQAPEGTEGREGFLHPVTVRGSAGEAEIDLIVRDFDTAKLAVREAALRQIVDTALARRPGASAEIEIVKQYRNMAHGLAARPEVMARAQAAIRRLGLQTKGEPIRGGTDGSQLTERGLPCPEPVRRLAQRARGDGVGLPRRHGVQRRGSGRAGGGMDEAVARHPSSRAAPRPVILREPKRPKDPPPVHARRVRILRCAQDDRGAALRKAADSAGSRPGQLPSASTAARSSGSGW